ncbi:hypothetical protein CLIB1423_15S03246 [[Candida] railenensis]|uniref:HTH APSES-type domain-containing protein n=1 Tax=[Candida] railenensis TaxID=45579 RepID=A0A9P0QSW3_9ASCO|nr:hypothetical protein CLIB1423_15S03246 [[Candida] railenensis]
MAAKLKLEDNTTPNHSNAYAPEYMGEPQNPSQDNLVRPSVMFSNNQAGLAQSYPDNGQAISQNQQLQFVPQANTANTIITHGQISQPFSNESNQNYYLSRSSYEGSNDGLLSHGGSSNTAHRTSTPSFAQQVPQQQQQYLQQQQQQQQQQQFHHLPFQVPEQQAYYSSENSNLFNMSNSVELSHSLNTSQQYIDMPKRRKISYSSSNKNSNTQMLQTPENSKRSSSGSFPSLIPKKPRIATTFWENENTICYQVEYNKIVVSRRQDSNYINATKLLNATGISRGKRDGILKAEKTKEVVKVGSMKLKGVWLPFERAAEFARNEGFDELLYPLFVKDIKGYLRNTESQTKSWDPLASPTE